MSAAPSPEPGPASDLQEYASRRKARIRAEIERAAASQRVYEHVTGKADDARQAHFRQAAERGATVEDIATATGLGADEVRLIIDRS